MSIAKDALTSEVCHVVITKLAYLAGSGQEALLREAGVSDAQISKLEKLSYRELDAWIRKNKGELDISPFMQAIFPESNIPPEWKAFLQHGANNKMMKHYFGARAEECSAWRERLTIEPVFRARSIAHKQHSAVCKALMAQGDYRHISADALLEVAKTHRVSLCALWKELETWDEEHEQ
ncbi:DUF2857 domain-containing protein (plasmid) [Vibrio campbellii]|uniref:STY4526/YPO1902 family pathogenicity island replication protein n=1 Tax=Vibrio campbellii TaxID=680 RepID=UPI001F0805DF|nr:STY4526/YPO1902 family pathogenicity island replication protein [Vibrio campbellii]UMM06913.1 DUF2857 domain-containing protein [Vibrio campbellii]